MLNRAKSGQTLFISSSQSAKSPINPPCQFGGLPDYIEFDHLEMLGIQSTSLQAGSGCKEGEGISACPCGEGTRGDQPQNGKDARHTQLAGSLPATVPSLHCWAANL